EPGAVAALPPTARHPAGSASERRAADAWLWQFVNKPLLDAPLTRYVYRPLARPLTRLFVRLPFSPNQITIASILIGQLGCVIASRPGYGLHLLGISIMAWVSGLLDNVDGELARLRLQGSKLGAWLDAVSDDFLRLCLMVALGSHVAPAFPGLPIWPIAIASAVLTASTMAPMYWYCVRVLGTPNTQHYMKVLNGGGRGLALGRIVAGRDFVDAGAFVLAVAGLPIVAVIGFAIGAVAGFAVVIPAHVAAVRGGARFA
ncbi:MAG: CDP-alcohol phosphatidyltransferase family protein, partial [Deltaproteobacteria bacterium]|nr:CDP-alcohol phosphatidyltransferase family protein [Kofleriaceae bacterium]